jgi:hypothetical protein
MALPTAKSRVSTTEMRSHTAKSRVSTDSYVKSLSWKIIEIFSARDRRPVRLNARERTETRLANLCRLVMPEPLRVDLTREERVRGIEPPCAAWEAAILPLNYTRILEEVNSESLRE